MSLVSLPDPPYRAEFLNKNTGLLSAAWSIWFEQMFTRIGGHSAISNISVANITSSTLASNYAGITNTTLYTGPTGLTTIIDSLTAKNNTGVAQTITIYLVPVGQTPGSTNIIMNAQSIAAGDTISITAAINNSIGSGATIIIKGSNPGGILVTLTGRQVS